MNDVAPRDRDIAMVFQNYALYPHMSVHGNFASRSASTTCGAARATSSSRRLPSSSGSASSSTGARATFRAASGNEWRWGVRSCASRERV